MQKMTWGVYGKWKTSYNITKAAILGSNRTQKFNVTANDES